MRIKAPQQEQAAQEEQAVQETHKYEAAVSRFKQACADITEKKRAMYSAFRKAEKRYKDNDYERVRLESGDPFSVAAVDTAVMNTGDPIDAKKYVSYARSVVRSVFLDDTFSAEVTRVIQAVCSDALAEESALMRGVREAEEELDSFTRQQQKKISQAKADLAAHRSKIKTDIIDPAMEADMLFLVDMPNYIAGPLCNRNLGIFTGPDIDVSTQLQSLLNQMNVERSRG